MDQQQASAAEGEEVSQDGAPQASQGWPDVHFPVVENGVDYLLSVVDHLTHDPTPRDLKYAVLHLQAATEVLLKARLADEHFSLVFKDPGRASHSSFINGSFESCGTKEVISRLRNIACVTIDEKDSKAVEALAQARNALQHYGLTASAYAVEAQAVRVLDFLLTFVRGHLVHRVTDEEADAVLSALDEVRHKLPDMKALIRRRVERARTIVAERPERILRCPECLEWTVFVPITGTPVTCLCCELAFDGDFYLEGAWCNLENAFDDDTETPDTSPCSKCRKREVVSIRTVKSPHKEKQLCFSCGEVSDDDAILMGDGT
jgi:hypothetical protein